MHYLKNMYDIKTKLAISNLPHIFTGGIYTISRAESINALIKRFVNSNCQISDLIKFLIAFEKKNTFKSFKTEKTVQRQYLHHPLILELKNNIHGITFDHHSKC